MNTMTRLVRDDAELAVHDIGSGEPVIFQHGLGGSETQATQAFPDAAGWRRITVECRGHGTSTLGTRRPFSIAMFAADIIAAADGMGIDRFAVGGISMGAAIAIHIAKAYPERVSGLILVRPAWTFAAAPENLSANREVAALLQAHPPAEARVLFEKSSTAGRLRLEAPDNLGSLLSFFDRSDARAFAEVLGDISADGTGVSESDAAAIAAPALVIGNREDAIHPMAVAQAVADALAHAEFIEAPAKARDATAHFAAVRAAIQQFLSKNRSTTPP